MFSTFANVPRCAVMIVAMLCAAAVATSSLAGFNIFSVGGDATPASIQPTVDTFRAALGDPNNGNSVGPLVGGRREINWDGGGAVVASPVGTPFTGFQNTRGGTFTTPGTGFLQTPLNVADLTNINATYATEFGTFSPLRIFTPLGSNTMDATFFIPGSNGATPATVAGFGAVFSDVDTANTTRIEFFDSGNNSILTLNAPIDSVGDAGLSFIGALANGGERIARVRITTGNSALGPTDQNGDLVDVVVMDDFLYSEPLAVPEPMTLLLTMVGLAGSSVLLLRRRRSPSAWKCGHQRCALGRQHWLYWRRYSNYRIA